MEHFVSFLGLPEVTYHRPANISEALDLLQKHQGKCRLIAGCTDFLPMIRRGKLKLATGTHLIDLKGINRLKEISIKNDKVVVGAAASYSSIIESSLIEKSGPLLAQVAADIGSMQIRNAGTIGGNLCSASPGADAVVGLLALDAKVLIAGPGYEKSVPLTEFFVGHRRTILEPGEIVTSVRFQAIKQGDHTGWLKLGRRKAFTMSVLSAATKFRVDDGRFGKVALAMGVAGPTPLRLPAVEQFLQGKAAVPDVIQEAAVIAGQTVQPRSSFRADAEYRGDMARVLTQRVLTSGLI